MLQNDVFFSSQIKLPFYNLIYASTLYINKPRLAADILDFLLMLWFVCICEFNKIMVIIETVVEMLKKVTWTTNERTK